MAVDEVTYWKDKATKAEELIQAMQTLCEAGRATSIATLEMAQEALKDIDNASIFQAQARARITAQLSEVRTRKFAWELGFRRK